MHPKPPLANFMEFPTGHCPVQVARGWTIHGLTGHPRDCRRTYRPRSFSGPCCGGQSCAALAPGSSSFASQRGGGAQPRATDRLANGGLQGAVGGTGATDQLASGYGPEWPCATRTTVL